MNILNQKDKNLRYIEPAFEIDLNKVRLLFRGKYPDESEIIDRIENLNYYWKSIEFLNIPYKSKPRYSPVMLVLICFVISSSWNIIQYEK